MSRLGQLLKKLSASPRDSGAERRRSPRVHFYKPFEVCFFDQDGSRFESGDALDLSKSGIRFATPQKFAEGSSLVMMIYFPPPFHQRKPLKIRTRVVRCCRMKGQRRYRVACKFDSMDSVLAPELDEFIDWSAGRLGEKMQRPTSTEAPEA